uniref:Uncharacterized protein n=1 Tax=Ascaris lumbricoides TaxID=6252 RepID=A0A0M3I702_ASCLU
MKKRQRIRCWYGRSCAQNRTSDRPPQWTDDGDHAIVLLECALSV